jgi:hypothetical protein
MAQKVLDHPAIKSRLEMATRGGCGESLMWTHSDVEALESPGNENMVTSLPGKFPSTECAGRNKALNPWQCSVQPLGPASWLHVLAARWICDFHRLFFPSRN